MTRYADWIFDISKRFPFCLRVGTAPNAANTAQMMTRASEVVKTLLPFSHHGMGTRRKLKGMALRNLRVVSFTMLGVGACADAGAGVVPVSGGVAGTEGATVAGAATNSAHGGTAGAAMASAGSGGMALGGGGAAAGMGGAAAGMGGVAAGSGGQTAGTGNSGGISGSAGAPSKNPEGVPPDYQLVIQESFADAASLAALKFADPADWVHRTEEGGYLESTAATYVPPHASLHNLAIFGSPKLGAFVLDAEVMQTNPSGGHRDFCIAWGLESPSRYYYAHIAEAHDAVAHNIHIVLDADRTAITKTFTPGFAWGTNVWHKLRVTRAASGDMAVHADGGTEPILTATDARLGSGYFGFGSFDDKGRVRNIRVWAPSAEKVPAGFFMAK